MTENKTMTKDEIMVEIMAKEEALERNQHCLDLTDEDCFYNRCCELRRELATLAALLSTTSV